MYKTQRTRMLPLLHNARLSRSANAKVERYQRADDRREERLTILRDFQSLIDAAVLAQAVRDDLVNRQGFTPDSGGLLVGAVLDAVVRPSTESYDFLAEPGIANPTLTITLMPNTDAGSRLAYTRAIFAVQRLCYEFAGDAALTAQHASTCVLRIKGVVHVDRNQVSEEGLSTQVVAPSPLVLEIPAIAE